RLRDPRPRPPARRADARRPRRCRARKPRRRSRRGPAATPRTSASGCGAFPASLWSLPTARRARSRMRSSRWHAHGNVYLLAEQADLTPERVRAGAPGTDGIVEVLSAGDDEAEVVIWNPDGSTAELSGNGTRIAAKWLAARTGAETVQI